MKSVLLMLLLPALVFAGSTTTVTTQILTPDHDTLRYADVTFELYGVSTVIDTNANVIVTPKIVRTKTDDSGYVSLTLLRNEYLIKQKSGAVHPWTRVTISGSTLIVPSVIYFTIDADSTGTFSFGVNTSAVQFTPPR